MTPRGVGTLIVTGANGFIGSWVTLRFAEAGWRVYAGCRNPALAPVHENVLPFTWNVGATTKKAPRFPRLTNVDVHPRVCLHLAFTTQHKRRKKGEPDPNVEGTLQARAEALRVGCDQQVFVSSFSAHREAKSHYGRTKFALEKEFGGQGDLVVRPALVVGAGGLFLRMQETLKKSPIVPLFDGGNQPVQVIDRDVLGEVLFQAIIQGGTGRLVVAAPGILRMREFMKAVAKSVGRTPLFVTVPARLVLPVVQGAEALGITLPITSENLLGLMAMKAQRPSNLSELVVGELETARQVLKTLEE